MNFQLSKNSCLNFLIFFLYFFLLVWFSPNLSFYLMSPDHGAQISAGKMVFFGYIPFRDILFIYGPLVPYTSAFGEWVTNSLIGETIICCIGHALSLFLIYFIVSKHSAKTIGFVSSIVGFLLISRFYKWYYVLFPLLALLCIYYYLNSKSELRSKWLYCGGFLCGIGGLYRFDVGLALFAIFIILVFFTSFKKIECNVSSFKLFLSNLMRYSVFFIIPFIVWFIFLLINGGSVLEYIFMSVSGGIGLTQQWSIPIPSFDTKNPFSVVSCTALAFLLVPVLLIFIIFYCFLNFSKQDDLENNKYIFLIMVSILALLLYPSTAFRSSYPHLLQGLPPVIIAVSIFSSDFFNSLSNSKKSLKKTFLGLLLISFLLIIPLIGLGISQFQPLNLGGYDLVKSEFNPIPRLQQLHAGINTGEDSTLNRLIKTVQNNTTISDKILIIPSQHQLYYFINRPMSGMTLWYGPAIFDNEYWRHKNFENILADPPKLIIVKNNFSDGYTNLRFDRYQPELYDYIINNYNSTLYQNEDWIVLKKSEYQALLSSPETISHRF